MNDAPKRPQSARNSPPRGTDSGRQLDEPRQGSLSERYPWAVFVIPFVAYMVLASTLPSPHRARFAASIAKEAQDGTATADETDTLQDSRRWKWFGGHRVGDHVYPVMYAVRIAVVIAIMLLLWDGYRQFFPLRVSLLSVVVGVVGVVLWVGLCHLGLEKRLLVPLGLGGFLGLGERAAFNPLSALEGDLPWLVGFLVIRFTGLALIVPVIEEFFLRGFVMRFVVDNFWEKVPFGHATQTAITVGTVYGVLTHPAEMVAAAVWFSLVTWLMLKTRNIWDCVMAHAVTNLLLGIYVLKTGHWELW